MKRAPPASGFTLIEIAVSTTLFAFISALALSLMIGMNNSSARVRVVGDAQTGGRLGLEGLAADIRAAGGGAASGQVGVAPGGGGGTLKVKDLVLAHHHRDRPRRPDHHFELAVHDHYRP